MDTTQYRPGREALPWLRAEFGLPDDALSIGMAAQFIERKGHATLLEALPDVPALQSPRPVCRQAESQPSPTAAARWRRPGCVLSPGTASGTRVLIAFKASSRLAPILYSTKPLNLSASSSIGGWLPPGWMVWPARWWPASCAMMLTADHGLPPVSRRTSSMNCGLNAMTRCGSCCLSSRIAAAAFGTSASVTSKFCGRPVNAITCSIMSRQSRGAAPPMPNCTGRPS